MLRHTLDTEWYIWSFWCAVCCSWKVVPIYSTGEFGQQCGPLVKSHAYSSHLRGISDLGTSVRSSGVRFTCSLVFTFYVFCLSFNGNCCLFGWSYFFTLIPATNSLLKLSYLKKRWYFVTFKPFPEKQKQIAENKPLHTFIITCSNRK